jgi:phosphoheptose isomerase
VPGRSDGLPFVREWRMLQPLQQSDKNGQTPRCDELTTVEPVGKREISRTLAVERKSGSSTLTFAMKHLKESQDELFRAELGESTRTLQDLAALVGPLEKAVEIVSEALDSGCKLLTCGNGGSAADAGHLATEFIIRFQQERPSLPAISLCESGSRITAAANDYGFDHIFERQVRGLGKPGDVLVAFSTSGNSRNVIRAIEVAKAMGLKSISFLGKGGGFTKGLADVELVVGSEVTARVQEAHLFLYHCLCRMTELRMGLAK